MWHALTRTRRRAAPTVAARSATPQAAVPGRSRRSPRALVEGLVVALTDARAPDQRAWRLMPLVLALAFAGRAAVALTGDFVLHPDEVMQYLEPAHRLVFGNGVVYWEYFYGARSWLIPGAVAGVLKLFDLVGLGQPWWYVAGVKLVFCMLSLAIPAGMYVFARRRFGETAARVALVAGAFWYELAGFAHKPLTELVATAPLMGLLALCVRPTTDSPRVPLQAAALAVLAGAIRMQYAPVALVLLAVVFLRTRHKLLLAGAAAALTLAVGIFDAVTWDGGLFHSYLTNLRFNLADGGNLSGQVPFHRLPWWFALAGGGLSVLCLAGALRSPRRYGLLVGLTALVLLIHSLPPHKELRFIFVVIPLWLLIGADLAARAAAWVGARAPARPDAVRWTMAAAGTLFAVVSIAGMLKALPAQALAYPAWAREAGNDHFLYGQDGAFAAYRYLARAPGVEAVWHLDRPYFTTPGYYYLHRAIPWYDSASGGLINRSMATVSASVSHLVFTRRDLTVPGYSPEREFGDIRILRRDAAGPPVRRWREYAPVTVFQAVWAVMPLVHADAPPPPANFAIEFAAGGNR